MGLRRITGNNKGVSSIEFALVLPFLLLILFGILEYGWIMTTQIVLTNAVSNGARAGIKAAETEEEADARAATIDAFWINTLAADDITVTIPESPRRIDVEVPGWTYSSLTGFLPSAMIPGSLKAKSIMVFP